MLQGGLTVLHQLAYRIIADSVMSVSIKASCMSPSPPLAPVTPHEMGRNNHESERDVSLSESFTLIPILIPLTLPNLNSSFVSGIDCKLFLG